MEQALKVIGTPKEETIMIGDYYDTDILAGMNAGLDTLLVHTGVTTRELLEGYEKKANLYGRFTKRVDGENFKKLSIDSFFCF